MTTPLANPRRTKLDSWPEPREVAKESDHAGMPDAAAAASSHSPFASISPSTSHFAPDAERTAQ